jgi:hypothetical protein
MFSFQKWKMTNDWLPLTELPPSSSQAIDLVDFNVLHGSFTTRRVSEGRPDALNINVFPRLRVGL